MNTAQDQAEVRKALRQSVEELAGQAMLADGHAEATAPLLAALSSISERAKAAGLEQIAAVAGAQTTDPKTISDTLERLQKALAEPAAKMLSIAADPDMIRDFALESFDHLTVTEAQLLILEQNPANQDAVHTIFRGFHTIKGLAGFLELPAIQHVAHEVETLLDNVRNGKLGASSALIDVVLAGADYLRTDIRRVEASLNGGVGEPADATLLVARVHAVMAGESTNDATDEGPRAVDLAAAQESSAAAADSKQDPKKVSGNESKLVKVDTDKLDFLVDMVGELVIAQSMVRHDGQLSALASPKLQRNLAQLSRITGEVQKTAMSMRMVPIRQLFQKSARLIRDLTRKSGKQVELDLTGEDTELDRTIVEELGDPLMHMIRNAADHGIEPPAERTQSGKNPTARLCLKAYHQSGHIVVEIADDGRGMDREKLIAKARQRGLLQDGSGLTDKEAFNLIFEPGFSTAEKVTDISGRGVGMDVVRKQIQKLRGRVEIESQVGLGTTFFLKLPLTLAIIEGLVVGVGKERYVIPIFVVREIFRPRQETIFSVEQREEMLLVRGELLPVIRLCQRFGVTPVTGDLAQSVVVVAEGRGKRFCLVVDELIGKQEVVIKNLGETFKQVPGVAGGAILGDGRVGLIIDMDGVFGEAAHG
jgi:two-component system chemotaxis sensor kinase CheA